MLVAVAAVESAQQLAAAVAGRKLYAFNVEQAIDYARDTEPDVILLSVFLGGSSVRALELIPYFLRINPSTHVIVLHDRPTDAQRAEAVRFGAFGIVDMAAPTWQERIRQITDAARRARLCAVRAASVAVAGRLH